MNIFRIERSDEGLAQPLEDLVEDLIPLMLQLGNLFGCVVKIRLALLAGVR
jgi:hypothetical protein